MRITRRKFLRFVPASVGVIALGLVVLPKDNTREQIWNAFYRAILRLPDSNTLYAMSETMLRAGQKAADPPLMYVSKGKVKIREFAFHGV